ncbi:uncharacterized protein [Ptychodera flava]|uniref:uncharacterized protein n=1 Tax=Ptychodera flava TaxID=63121 RepID=UPI00396A7A2D
MEAQCSRIYTNHCLRARTVTTLDDEGFEARHIMSISGHKSETSIRQYARVGEEKKREMSKVLSSKIQGSPSTSEEYPPLQIAPTPGSPILTPSQEDHILGDLTNSPLFPINIQSQQQLKTMFMVWKPTKHTQSEPSSKGPNVQRMFKALEERSTLEFQLKEAKAEKATLEERCKELTQKLEYTGHSMVSQRIGNRLERDKLQSELEEKKKLIKDLEDKVTELEHKFEGYADGKQGTLSTASEESYLEDAKTETTALEEGCKEPIQRSQSTEGSMVSGHYGTQGNKQTSLLSELAEKKTFNEHRCDKMIESEGKDRLWEPKGLTTLMTIVAVIIFVAVITGFICFQLGHFINSVDHSPADMHFNFSKQCTGPEVTQPEDLPFEDLIPVCSSGMYNQDKCQIVNAWPGIKDKVKVLPARFCLSISGYATDYMHNIYVQRYENEITMPTVGDFEYIESDVIEISFGSSNSFRGKVTLGFWKYNNQPMRPHSIMTSEDGISWKELPSSQKEQIVIAAIQNSGYYLVKSKPYQDSFKVDANGCDYSLPMTKLLRISVPKKATLKPLVFNVTIVYPNQATAGAVFGQEDIPVLSPIIYIREMDGRKAKFREKVIVTLPLFNELGKVKLDTRHIKTWIFEDYHIDNRWSDITTDITLYSHRDSVSFKIDHFSAYLAFAAQATFVFSGLVRETLANDIGDYVEKSKTGKYFANFILLQSKAEKTCLLFECVKREGTFEKIEHFAKSGYDISDDGTIHYTADIEVMHGQRINITVNREFEPYDKDENTQIICHPDGRNHRIMTVKLHQNVTATVKNTGTVMFSHSDTDHEILRFAIKHLHKQESINTGQQIENTQNAVTVKESRTDVPQDQGRTADINRKKSGILIIGTEWGTWKGGLSTVNRLIAELAVESGKEVYATTLEATTEDKADAQSKGIHLFLPSKEDASESPDLFWLTKYYQVYYKSIQEHKDIDVIIGHLPITSTIALRMHRDWFPSSKVILFNHVIPEDTDVHKSSWTAEKVQEKEKKLCEEAVNSSVVFSVGPKIYSHFENKYRAYPSLRHKQFLPLPDKMFFDIKMKKPSADSKIQILTFGRVKGVSHLKGYDIVASALSKVAADFHKFKPHLDPPVWTIRGIPAEEENASREYIAKNITSGKLHYNLYPYGSQNQIRVDLQQSHLCLMPSRSEPFGMVGLEAIAAGTPVLLTRNSGLAKFLLEHVGWDMANAVILDVGYNDLKPMEDVQKWADRIQEVLNGYDVAYDRAQKMKVLLQANVKIKETHETFKQELDKNDAILKEQVKDEL